MSQKYILIDSSNLAARIRHGYTNNVSTDISTTISLMMHTIFTSVKKVWTDFQCDHMVFCLDARSWRRDFYVPYKAHRRALADKRTEKEIEDDQLFYQALDDFVKFITTKTNCTVLRHPKGEADDMIARFIHLHPDDEHIIVSSDSDFQQLLANNVKIYNGISALLYTIDGILDKDGKNAVNKKGQPLEKPNPEWILFEKIIRGDSSDNVMSAYPGVRKKRIEEAFQNRDSKGYSWNNLMLSTWIDHEGNEIRVKDAYERNKTLIDLREQPDYLKQEFDKIIEESVNKEKVQHVGVNLIKFANSWGLLMIEKFVSDYSPCFSKPYTGNLLNNG